MADSFNVKIFGAGSIGNHLANASRVLGWKVDLVDISTAALERASKQIYPSRYGEWDSSIGLFELGSEPTGGYDLIIIGTPPDSHIPLALQALEESPRGILIEKPLCGPGLESASIINERATAKKIPVFVGYDHVVGLASEKFRELINDFRNFQTLDVEFREHWGGIFAAHPWLNGPADTYLGFWQKGGGASGEHSHGINLWQHFAHTIEAGRVTRVSATINYVDEGVVDYDNLAFINLETERGFVGRVVQDVVTSPARKWARLQCDEGFIEWQCGQQKDVDVVQLGDAQGLKESFRYEKTRPQDFIQELTHVNEVITNKKCYSPISLTRGLETMMVIAAAHKSALERRTVYIDYSQGFIPSGLI